MLVRQKQVMNVKIGHPIILIKMNHTMLEDILNADLGNHNFSEISDGRAKAWCFTQDRAYGN